MSVDELVVESAITKELKTVSEVDTVRLTIASDITMELKIKIPVEIELI